jgi:hypothetical protein
MLTKKQQRIHNQRTKDYKSDGVTNLRDIGLIWTGILQEFFHTELPVVIPTHIVAVMMAAVKLSRIAGGVYKDDNYIDAIVYLEISQKGYPDEAK